MKYLVDTMVISEPARPRPASAVVAWLTRQRSADLALSVMTIGEIAKGVALMPPGRRRDTLQEWVRDDLTRQFAGRVLPIDDDVARSWGWLTAKAHQDGRPLPVVDGLLLATAQVHGLALVTRNESDATGRGVEVLNPYANGP